MASSSSSSSSVARKGWTYDVFLSFRGEDTRNKFVDHLYAALTLKGIQTFKDDKMLGGGQPISEELVKAVKESRFAVVVFSKNYANSSWCLEELSSIMECQNQMGQKVLPVFYHVDPSDVRKQNGVYAAAFETHEDKFKGEMDRVNKWRDALSAAASLSGQHILPDYGGEAEFISKIVQQILTDRPRGSRENHLIGIESHIDALNLLMKMEATEVVRIVGIWGMGGIGKTTIARVLFNRIAHKFQGSSFVADVRENSSGKRDMCTLQQRILKNILGELICIKIQTFRTSSPLDGYMDLTNRAINYTRRLPLALKVLGSYLCGRQAGVWGSALDTLAKTPSGEVLDTLKLSFDSLNGLEKQIFLDIACFYKGEDVDDVTRILDGFGFDPVIGISVLVEKSLITISSNNRLDMHDLIQEMGWKVVEESAPNSRLWQHEKIYDVIRKNRELELIEGIVVPWRCKVGLEYSMSVDVFQRTKNLRLLDCYRKFTCGKPTFLPYESKQRLGADVFKSMKNLRLLCCEGKFTCRKPTFLPDELRWFCWEYYPFSSLPAVAHMSKLVGLEVIYGRIEHLWKGKKIMLQNLKFINLKSCESLKRFPDVSGAPNIERLDLSLCENLVEVDESVGSLKKLVELNMIWCLKLKCLPSMLHMESLEILLLRDCWSLKRIPEFSPCMVKVSHLDFSYCRIITEVPSSIKYLSNLSYLNLEICHGLKNIPNSIWELKRLNTLHFSFSLMKLPDEFQSIKSLEELHIKIPGSIIDLQALTNFSSLRKLHLHGNTADNDFPEDLHGLSSLEQLYITENSTLIHLPESISHLSGLKHLQLVCCWGLKTIHGLPSGIQVLIAKGCKSLEKIEHLSKEYQCLYKIELLHCNKLIEDEENERYLDKILEQSFLEKWVAVDGCLNINISRSNIPSWFKAQQDGHQIALKLRPIWQTKIAGFAMCCVSRREINFREIRLRFENDGMFVPKSKADNINEIEKATNVNVWIGYIPFSLFEQLHEDNTSTNDLEYGDWFHMTQGNLVFDFSTHLAKVERCGAQVVYREDVTSIQQTIPALSSYYWTWKLTNSSANVITCI